MRTGDYSGSANPTATTIRPPARSTCWTHASTKKPPSRPCGLPTRPTGTSSEPTLGELGERLFAGGLQLCTLVQRLSVLEVEQPVRARLVLVGHPDAAGVDDAYAGDRPLEL